MTIHAFKDAGDGYYQVDVPDGQPMPAWTAALTPCAVQAPPAVPTAVLLQQYNTAIQNVLDAYAQSLQFDNMNTMVTYVGDPNPTFSAQATAGRNWRSQVWTFAGAAMAAIQAGTQPMPASVETFIATLPAHP